MAMSVVSGSTVIRAPLDGLDPLFDLAAGLVHRTLLRRLRRCRGEAHDQLAGDDLGLLRRSARPLSMRGESSVTAVQQNENGERKERAPSSPPVDGRGVHRSRFGPRDAHRQPFRRKIRDMSNGAIGRVMAAAEASGTLSGAAPAIEPRVLAMLSGGADSVCLLHVTAELLGAGTGAGAARQPRPASGSRRTTSASAPTCAPGSAWSCTSSVSRSPRGETRRRSRAKRATRRPSACAHRAGLRPDRHRPHGHGPGRDHPLPAGVVAGPPGAARHGAARGRLVRPLLGVPRADTRAYCAEAGLPWREDESNADRRLARNRLRLEVLPAAAGDQPGGGRATCSRPLPSCATRRRCSSRRWTRRCGARGAGGVPPAVDAGAPGGRACRPCAGWCCAGSPRRPPAPRSPLGPERSARDRAPCRARGQRDGRPRRRAACDGRVRDRPLPAPAEADGRPGRRPRWRSRAGAASASGRSSRSAIRRARRRPRLARRAAARRGPPGAHASPCGRGATATACSRSAWTGPSPCRTCSATARCRARCGARCRWSSRTARSHGWRASRSRSASSVGPDTHDATAVAPRAPLRHRRPPERA